jgi:hypothetical protein
MPNFIRNMDHFRLMCKRNRAKLTKPHRFTEEECSDGGATARGRERMMKIPLNHGVTFGRRSDRGRKAIQV